MALKSDPEMGINSWLEDELYQQYLRDRSTVDESWKHLFEETNGALPKPAEQTKPADAATADLDGLQPLRGAAGRVPRGTSVPGIGVGIGNRTEGVIYGDSVNDYLASLNVPDGRNDDYAIAVESGRSVAGLLVPDGSADAVRGMFSSAGATVVDVF